MTLSLRPLPPGVYDRDAEERFLVELGIDRSIEPTQSFESSSALRDASRAKDGLPNLEADSSRWEIELPDAN